MSEGSRSQDMWWMRCYFRDLAGLSWAAYLLEQGAAIDDGAWVVVEERDQAKPELESQGRLLWVVTEEGDDRLVPVERLEHVELVLVE